MPCYPFNTMRDGKITSSGFVCIRGKQRRVRCAVCGDWSTALCDHELEGGRTCDLPICGTCATHVGRDTDYCPAHAPQKELFG